MKIEPKHDFMKPAYVLGALVMAAVILTGCPDSQKTDETTASQPQVIDGSITDGIV